MSTKKSIIKKTIPVVLLVTALSMSTTLFTFGEMAAASTLTLEREPGAPVYEQPLTGDAFQLTARSDAFGGIHLAWKEIPDVSGYVVYRYNEWTKTYDAVETISDSKTTTFTDSEVAPGQAYFYQVTPLFALVEKEGSEVVEVKAEAKTPVLTLKVDDTDVHLSWDKIDGAEKYILFRATEKDGKYTTAATVEGPETEYTDWDMTTGKTYYYKLRAYMGDKRSDESNTENTGLLTGTLTGTTDDGEGQKTVSAYAGETLTWPLPSAYNINSGFGYRDAPAVWGATSQHDGIDIGCSHGASVVAAANGIVVETSYSDGRGEFVVVDHGNGLKTLYQHLSATDVEVGQVVENGETIAYAGNTGASVAPHLHFEVWEDGTPVDPTEYL